jgi:Flp pilus assembly protein TadD
MILAYLAYHQENYDGAQELLRKIVNVDKENGLAWSLLGQTYQTLGRTEQALACYVQALKIDPRDELARSLMVALDQLQVSREKNHDKL